MKLYLDPGHGGIDPGAVANGLQEKDLTLKIAFKIKAFLEGYENVEIKMSRTTDKTVSLSDRTNEANAWGADFYLSIHINAGGGEGYEDFIYLKLSDSSRTAQIRSILHDEIMHQVDFKNRGKKKKDLHVLRVSRMHGVLTESGFIDNVNDAKKLKSESYLNQIALGHANGIVKAFKLQKSNKKSAKKVNVITGWYEEGSEGLKELEKYLESKGFYYRKEDAF